MIKISRVAIALVLTLSVIAVAAPAHATAEPESPKRWSSVRFAQFNASLNRNAEGELVADLATKDNQQAATIAEIIQRQRPDVLLINEFDYVASGEAVDLFRRNYLEVGQGGAAPIRYDYSFIAPVNTGLPSGFDLDHDGTIGGPNDAWGFGQFPGQYGMLVLSRFPIDTDNVRTFQNFKWADMPGAKLPPNWYSSEELAQFPLSSKSHWDLPIRIRQRPGPGSTVRFLVSHPTPPAFDGPERRNKLRNYDEIRFWADYVNGGNSASYIYDDQGRRGGLPARADFVIAGDQNSDPNDGDSEPGAIQQLLQNRRVNDPAPTSVGAVEAAAVQGGANDDNRSDPRYDTADFNDNPAPGNLRVDYVLPSRRLPVTGAGVFWPLRSDPLVRLTGEFPFPGSDHRLVWVDVRVR